MRRGDRAAGCPVPGKQFVNLPGRVGCEAAEDVAQMSFRIDTVELGGLD